VNLLVSYDQSTELDISSLTTLSAMAAKVALISRSVIGADELTGENLSLFSNKKHFENLAKIEVEHFEKISKEVKA
jgi:hypothetical protein